MTLVILAVLLVLLRIGDGFVVRNDTIITMNHFLNNDIVYIDPGEYTVVNPLELSLATDARIDLYRIESFHQQWYNWNGTVKTKMIEYRGPKLYKHIIYSADQTYTHALVLIRNSAGLSGSFQIQVKRDDCLIDVPVDENPTVAIPGNFGAFLPRAVRFTSNMTCQFRLFSRSQKSFTIKWATPYRYNVENANVNGFQNFSRTVPFVSHAPIKVEYWNKVPYSTPSMAGFQFSVTVADIKFKTDDDGSLKLNFRNKWYYIQAGSLTVQDMNLICKDMGHVFINTFGARKTWPNETMIYPTFGCQPDARSIHQCNEINTTTAYFRNFLFQENQITTISCQDKNEIKYNEKGFPIIRIGNEWREICLDGMGWRAADVICREMGYSVALSRTAVISYPRGNLIRSVNCFHQESFRYCDFSFASLCECQINLQCRSNPGLLRIDGDYHNKGEAKFDDKHICFDSFSKSTADRFCKDFGFHYAIHSWGSSWYNGSVVHVDCSGREKRISECRFNHTQFCPSGYVANVFCQNLKLAGGRNKDEGRVEVVHGGRNGILCDDNLNYHSANVICRQLGFKSAKNFYPYAHSRFGKGTGPMILDDLTCRGNEDNINNCSHRAWGSTSCNQYEVAGVACQRGLETCNRTQLINGYADYKSFFNISSFQALVQIKTYVDKNPDATACNGVVIRDQWVLTSASCLRLHNYYYRVYKVGNDTQGHYIFNAFVHPGYSYTVGEHNLALLKVNSLFTDDWVCLGESGHYGDGTKCVAIGSMNSSNWNPPLVIQQKVALKNDSECAARTRLAPGQIDSLFCSEIRTDPFTSFNGHSGGPVICQRPDGSDVLAGITNKAILANKPSVTAVYTKIYKYAQWIKDTLARN